MQVKKVVVELFEITTYYPLNEIIERVLETIDTNTNVIYYTLYDMIDNKTPLWNHRNTSGYLINKNNYYLFQPHDNSDEALPLYYRGDSGQPDQIKYIQLKDNLFTKDKKVERVYGYDEIYNMMKVSFNENSSFLKKYSFNTYIDNYKGGIYQEYTIDDLSYKEKVILMKDILKEYLLTGSVDGLLRNKVFEFFKDNLIYEKDLNYYLLEKTKKVVGFFLFNTEAFYAKKKQKLKELDEIEKDFSYFIFKNDVFYETMELNDGQLIRDSIKRNFLKSKSSFEILKTEPVWGYPFKLENNKTVYKLVDEKTKTPNKLPGRVLSQIAKKNSVRAYLRIYFKENYNKLMDNDPDIDNQTKNFLFLLIEMIIRNKEKNRTNGRHSVIPYDIVFLKFIE